MKDLKGSALGWPHHRNPVPSVEILHYVQDDKVVRCLTAVHKGQPYDNTHFPLPPHAENTPDDWRGCSRLHILFYFVSGSAYFFLYISNCASKSL